MAELIKLLNRDRDLVAVIDRYTSFSYERRLNAATSWDVVLPLGDLKQSLLDVSNYVTVERDSIETFTGKITSRSIGPESVTVGGYSEEIELERAVTPAQYGLVFSNMDLAQVAEELTWDRAVLRVKDKSEWEAAVAQTQVDLDSEPGLVVLDKDSGGAYFESGSIRLRFDANTVDDFTTWERIRWASDNDAPVQTTMQYRYGASIGALSAWSDPVPGVLTDEIGVVPAATTERYLEVQINLSTTDTTSDGIGYSPAVFALEVIAKTRQIVEPVGGTLGLTGETVSGIAADSETHLAVLQQACEQLGYEFMVRAGELHLAKELSTDRTAEFVLRAGSNIAIESLGDTDEQLVNVLTAYGPGTGINRMQVVLEDTASIATYGRYPGTQEFSAATDLADLTTRAQEWLDNHKQLSQSYTVHAAFPPDQEPVFTAGDLVQVADPVSGVVAEVRVLGITRQVDVATADLQLDLGTPAKSLVDVILDDLDPDRGTRLALAVPVSLRATPASPGITVSVNPYVNSRSAGVEIHMADSADFTPSAATVVGRGQATSYVITGLITGARYYFKARSYDVRGEYSAFTNEVSTLAGGVDIDDIGPIDHTKFASGIRPVRVGTALPELPDPTNFVIGDFFALYPEGGGSPVLYLAEDTDDDTFADSWKPAVNTEDLEGVITGDQILANSITAGQIAAGAISATELAADAVTAAKIAAGAVEAQHIKTGSILANHIAITDMSNIIGNPVFEQGLEGWTGVDSLVSLGTSTALPASMAGSKVVRSTTTAGAHRLTYGNFFPVTPGEAYYVSVWARKGSAIPNSPLNVGMEFTNNAGSSFTRVSAFVVPTSIASGTWVHYEGTLIAPGARTWGRFFADIPPVSPASGAWYFTKAVLRRAVDTRLLVDGTIEITNSDKNNGALSVKNASDQEVLRLGNIVGKLGVPSGSTFGLWGVLGSGIYIQGASRTLWSRTNVSASYTGSQMNHPSTRRIEMVSANYFINYTPPPGRAVYVVASLQQYFYRDLGASGWDAMAKLNAPGILLIPEVFVDNSTWMQLSAAIRYISGREVSRVRIRVVADLTTILTTVFEPQLVVQAHVSVEENDVGALQ